MSNSMVCMHICGYLYAWCLCTTTFICMYMCTYVRSTCASVHVCRHTLWTYIDRQISYLSRLLSSTGFSPRLGFRLGENPRRPMRKETARRQYSNPRPALTSSCRTACQLLSKLATNIAGFMECLERGKWGMDNGWARNMACTCKLSTHWSAAYSQSARCKLQKNDSKRLQQSMTLAFKNTCVLCDNERSAHFFTGSVRLGNS